MAALEILVFTTAIANLVREGKTHQIPGMIQVGKKHRATSRWTMRSWSTSA